MAQLVTLKKFCAQQAHYHIYRTRSSSLDQQDHYHNYYQICLVTSGELIHKQNTISVPLCAGDAFIIPPGYVHSLHFCSDKTEICSLSFEEALFHPGFPKSNAYSFLTRFNGASAAKQTNVQLRIALDAQQRKNLLSLMDCLIRQQDSTCPPGLSAAPSIIAAIVYLLAQSYYQQPQTPPPAATISDYSSILSQCITYIDNHFNEKLTLTGLSKQFGISRSSLCAAFPQFSGMPLQKYISQKRINQAQLLIRAHPEMALGQIAMAVGYEENSTFYRNFIRISGISPTKYRQLCADNASG